MAEVGKRSNEAVGRALPKAVFSEYQTVAEHVVPYMIKKYGKLCLRANEQGQEAAGQMIKRMIKSGTFVIVSFVNRFDESFVRCQQEEEDRHPLEKKKEWNNKVVQVQRNGHSKSFEAVFDETGFDAHWK